MHFYNHLDQENTVSVPVGGDTASFHSEIVSTFVCAYKACIYQAVRRKPSEVMSELSLPSVWRQKSTDTMAKAAKQRSTLQEYRSAYWKFNSDTRRAQYSMQVQVNDSLKKKKSTLCLLIDQLSTTHQAAIPVLKTLEEIKGTLEKELEEKERLLARNAERLGIRAQRPPQELVADEPQRQLLAQ
ncbi:hypothetical protein CYMTET_10852, partial [Cymbomonas tetramitiformis]